MTNEPGKPKQYTLAIRKLDASPDDEARFARVIAGSQEHAASLAASKGLIDPHTEEVVGITEASE